MSNVKGLLNCLVRFKVTSLRDLAGMAGKRSASPNLFDTEGWPEVKNPKLVRKVKKNMENQTMEGKTLEKNLVEENIETTIAKGCSDCDVLNNSVGDFDKRQDLFSQVIDPEDNVQLGHSKKNVELIVEQARRERINVHSRACTTGWVVKKILNKLKITCKGCKTSLTSKKSSIHDWISQREYNEAKDNLIYPSEGAVRYFGTVIKETNEYLEQNPHHNKIATRIKDIILSKYSFDFFDCAEHKNVILHHFINIVIRFTIINWCSIINKILKGTDVFRLQKRSDLPPMQKKALEKFKKKLKNKRFNK
ncbi:hypothetical protein ACJJTC_003905 [Scirpophaga incertulas]